MTFAITEIDLVTNIILEFFQIDKHSYFSEEYWQSLVLNLTYLSLMNWLLFLHIPRSFFLPLIKYYTASAELFLPKWKLFLFYVFNFKFCALCIIKSKINLFFIKYCLKRVINILRCKSFTRETLTTQATHISMKMSKAVVRRCSLK